MTANSLQELYVEQLQDLYSAEQQIIKALPKRKRKPIKRFQNWLRN